MPTDVTQAHVDVLVGGNATGAISAFEATRQGLERVAKTGATVGERVKAALQLKRLEGETALDRILSGNGEKALDLLIGAGPKVAITAFAMRGLGNAAEMAVEHMQKLREGTEGVADAILKVGESIPIFGEAIRAGAGLGSLIRSIYGAEDPERELKTAQDRDAQLQERSKRRREGFERDRLIGLRGAALEREKIEQEFTHKSQENDRRVLEDRKKDSEYRAKLEETANAINFTPGGDRASVRARENIRQLDAETKQAGVVQKEEAARIAKEKAETLKEFNYQNGRDQLAIVRNYEQSTADVRREIQAQALEREGNDYQAKRLQLEGEYQKRVTQIAVQAEQERHAHPELARKINAGAADAERAAKEKLNADLRRSDEDTGRARTEKLRREGQETQDIRDQTGIKLLLIARQTDAAELQQLKEAYLNQREVVQRERDKQLDDLQEDAAERTRVTKSSGDKLIALAGKYAADIAAARQGQEDRAGDRTFGIDEQIRQSRIDAVRSINQQEAEHLAILDKQLATRQHIAEQLRGQLSTGDRLKLGALGIINDLTTAAALKRLATGGSQPTPFGLEDASFLTGVVGRQGGSNSADKLAEMAANLATLVDQGGDMLSKTASLLSAFTNTSILKVPGLN